MKADEDARCWCHQNHCEHKSHKTSTTHILKVFSENAKHLQSRRRLLLVCRLFLIAGKVGGSGNIYLKNRLVIVHFMFRLGFLFVHIVQECVIFRRPQLIEAALSRYRTSIHNHQMAGRTKVLQLMCDQHTYLVLISNYLIKETFLNKDGLFL